MTPKLRLLLRPYLGLSTSVAQLIGHADLIRGNLLTALNEEYLADLPNRGNRSAKYSASSDDIDNISKTLARATFA